MAENFRGRKGIIIGGGASGLMAAITAAEQGAAVTVIEHTARPGKKILSTGNGKCNLTNLYMDPSFYRSDEKGFWGTAIRNFPPKAAVAFFRNLGVLTMDRGGYVYPMSGQAQTVLDA
ncbi:MAG: NAD(P)/FAD-dependent oxidoreductase, partial [Pilosibacter sp.]